MPAEITIDDVRELATRAARHIKNAHSYFGEDAKAATAAYRSGQQAIIRLALPQYDDVLKQDPALRREVARIKLGPYAELDMLFNNKLPRQPRK